VNLYNKGLIYRHERIINWCTRCATALSDLEVNYEEQDGALYYINYPLADDPSSHVTVATTRPETMLGDTGVAVHPEDPRYRDFVGKMAVLPIMGHNIPIVGDEAIEQEFGTGALKVTPGHDMVDFEIGQRHDLEIITVIGLDGNMTEAAGKYAGKERFDVRKEVVAELESLELLEKVEEYQHSVGRCQRCDSVVEPLISLQWFVNVGSHEEPDSIAGKAHAAVAQGDIKLVPERFTRVYLNWLENIRDWCISRQLWWGHRIPVWYCQDCGELIASVDDPTACAACGSSKLEQDADVLDTWFSSGLWPHSTLGWPEDTEDFKYFYPTTVLETGYDILFFWVARMIMMGIENTGEVPFKTVFLHGLIRDATGAKMSKTRGNTMDPLELIDKYGTDALRFALTTGTAPGNDLRFTESRLEAARNFANKVWNASRFVMTSIQGKDGLDGWFDLPAPEHREDRWIISRLNKTTEEVNHSLETFELGEAQQKLYDFIWNDYCDWYIEMAKIRIRSGATPSPLPTLVHVLERTLRLLHPFMPFITEEIWQNLLERLPEEGNQAESIMVSRYPWPESGRENPEAEQDMRVVMQSIKSIRNTRALAGIPSHEYLKATLADFSFIEGFTEFPGTITVYSPNNQSDPDDGVVVVRPGVAWNPELLIREESDVIRSLARVEPNVPNDTNLVVVLSTDAIPVMAGPLVWHLAGEGIDHSEIRPRLQAELAECQSNLDRVGKLVSNPNFRAKAKPEVVETEEERLKSLEERQQRLNDILEQLEG
jgi:valyl-tRNA synthetase